MNEVDQPHSLHDLVHRFGDLRIEQHIFDTPHHSESEFFRLPAELRAAVYVCALIDHEPNLVLLQTCKAINMEAKETLYLRPASFNSQAKLFAWIERSNATHLSRVRTLTLRLTDIDLTPLLDQESPRRRTRMSAWSLYRSDLEKLEKALHALSKLERLTIIPPRVGRSQLWRSMYQSFLAEVPNRCKRLRHLELHDREEIMEEVPALKEVRHVEFVWPNLRSTFQSTADRKDSVGLSTGASKVDEWLEETQTIPTPPLRKRGARKSEGGQNKGLVSVQSSPVSKKRSSSSRNS